VVNNVDQIVTIWCQKEQIKIVADEVDSGTDLNLNYPINSSPSNNIYNNVPNKVNHALASPWLVAAGHQTIRFLFQGICVKVRICVESNS
jgi:hypothetical protein